MSTIDISEAPLDRLIRRVTGANSLSGLLDASNTPVLNLCPSDVTDGWSLLDRRFVADIYDRLQKLCDVRMPDGLFKRVNRHSAECQGRAFDYVLTAKAPKFARYRKAYAAAIVSLGTVPTFGLENAQWSDMFFEWMTGTDDETNNGITRARRAELQRREDDPIAAARDFLRVYPNCPHEIERLVVDYAERR